VFEDLRGVLHGFPVGHAPHDQANERLWSVHFPRFNPPRAAMQNPKAADFAHDLL
jgi:hypothetical protein